MGPGKLLTPSRSFPEPRGPEAGSVAACHLPDGGWATHLPPPPPTWNESTDGGRGPWSGLGLLWAGCCLLLSCPESRLGRKPACSHACLAPGPQASHFLLGPNCHSPCRAGPHTGWGRGRGSSASWGRRALDLVFLPVLRPQPSSQGPAPRVREEGSPARGRTGLPRQDTPAGPDPGLGGPHPGQWLPRAGWSSKEDA